MTTTKKLDTPKLIALLMAHGDNPAHAPKLRAALVTIAAAHMGGKRALAETVERELAGVLDAMEAQG